MKKQVAFLLALGLILTAKAQVPVDIALVQFASGFDKPVDLVHAGDERLFVVEKDGLIRILRPDGTIDPTPFLDMQSLTNTGGNNSEQGFLGLAFHPDYANNGYFFVNYTRVNGNTRISRFTVSSDPDVADFNSREDILDIDQPYGNHNGGCLRFGPDGYLYIGTGDGGDAGDPDNYGQNVNSLLGKMLRIDIDNGLPYSIPSDNPFIGTSTEDEIWAIGLRNPWKFTFDSSTNDLWIADVGQNQWEEIDFQSAASTGGENYGWRCYEGNNPFETAGCNPQSSYVDAIAEFSHSSGHCSITGGEVYRGVENADMIGKYFAVDYCSGQFWSVEMGDLNQWVVDEVSGTEGFGWSTFGSDVDGELYVVNQSQGTVFHVIDEDCEFFEAQINIAIGANDLVVTDADAVTWYVDGVEVPDVTGNTFVNAAEGTYVAAYTNSDGCFGVSEELFFTPNSLEDIVAPWVLSSFPNPASDQLSIRITGSEQVVDQIMLVNILGETVFSKQIGMNGIDLTERIDVSSLAVGQYTLLIRSGEEAYEMSISIKR